MQTTTRRPSLREWLGEIMEPYEPGPGARRLSLYVDIFILFCIVASCAFIVLELVHDAAEGSLLKQTMDVAEVAFASIFVVEYLVRWYASKDRRTYPFTFFAIIDFVAVAPSVPVLVLGWQKGRGLMALRAFRGVRLLRVARALRLLRLLKFFRHGYIIYRFLLELRIRVSAAIYVYRLGNLARLVVWVVLAWVIGANVLRLTESVLVGPTSPYHDYWQSYWNIIIVLVSGMDTESPVTLTGRVWVTLLLVAGICVVGMLTGEIVSVILRRAQRAGRIALKPPRMRLEQHIVIMGRNRRLGNVIRQIQAALGEYYHYILVVCPDADTLPAGDPEVYRRVFALAGDPAREEVLREAAVEQALRVVVLSSDTGGETDGGTAGQDADSLALMQAVAAACRNRSCPLVVELQDRESLRYAAALENAECLLSRRYGERLISQAILNPGITAIYDELMSYIGISSELYAVPVPSQLVGKTFKEAQLYLLDIDEAVVPVGVDRSPPGGAYRRFRLNPTGPRGEEVPEEERTLRPEDNLIVIAYDRPSFAPVREEDIWSGKVLAGT